MATFLERLLEDEYTVHTAATGSAALRWLADHTPALIVLDLELPDMSGYDVLQTLQNTPSLAEIPVFVLSAHSRSMIPVRCFDLGAEEFLSKPFNPEELQVRLHKLNGAEESAGPP